MRLFVFQRRVFVPSLPEGVALRRARRFALPFLDGGAMLASLCRIRSTFEQLLES
jgi:hypothetical protein